LLGNIQQNQLIDLVSSDQQRTFGVLLAGRHSAAQPFTPADVRVLESIASRSAVALVKARLYEEIEFANQQKNRFLSMLAHELRNPLAPIQSAVDLMRLSHLEDADLVWARDVIGRRVAPGPFGGRPARRFADHARQDPPGWSRSTRRGIVPAAVEISRPLIEAGGHQLDVTWRPARASSWATGPAAQVLANL
jgi:signal transduction histidine kinase